jgi:hypothetical protein
MKQRVLSGRIPYSRASWSHASETSLTAKTSGGITRPQLRVVKAFAEYKIESRSRSAINRAGVAKHSGRAEAYECLATVTRQRLTRKPPFFFFSSCWRGQRSPRICLCYRKPDIAALAKGIQVLQPAQQGRRRSVHGFRLSSAPA